MTEKVDRSNYRVPVYWKTANIFSQIKGKKIVISTKRQSGVEEYSDAYCVYSPCSESPATYSQFEHELAHLVFESDDKFNYNLSSEMTRKYGLRFTTVMSVVEAFDCLRVQSFWRRLYAGSEKHFKKHVSAIGEDDRSVIVKLAYGAKV
ncbi:MAG: hypothetical protein QXI37_02045, partial [Thermoprotei archaeon]